MLLVLVALVALAWYFGYLARFGLAEYVRFKAGEKVVYNGDKSNLAMISDNVVYPNGTRDINYMGQQRRVGVQTLSKAVSDVYPQYTPWVDHVMLKSKGWGGTVTAALGNNNYSIMPDDGAANGKSVQAHASDMQK